MTNLLKAINGIDWKQLREQKIKLIEMQLRVNQGDFDTLDGLLNLIDAIQDAAVNDGIATEEAVCGPAEESDRKFID